ncbi:MAG: DUF547 domain-containing protein [Cyclobacteriaceae bacterium]|nr:DUF547 domain-containing protein [Cyclobacteriaceae bacterium]
MKFFVITTSLIVLVVVIWILGAWPVSDESSERPDMNLITLSERFLYTVKTGDATDSLEQALSNYSLNELESGLTNDTARKLFWVNLYNAWYQILAGRESKTQPGIFTEKAIYFAGFKLSLDDIEHGILRRYRWKYSLGYLPQFLLSSKIKRLAVREIDYRIHFALNCGAKSCPPIAFYSYDELDEQLDKAARSFLSSETEVDAAKKEVHVTRIMYWFKGDFGGNNGIRKILSAYLGQDFTDYSIQFKDYDWSPDLNRFAEHDE